MSDTFKSYTASLRDPIVSADDVNANDAADLPTVSRALFIGGTGDVRVTLLGGDVVTFRSMANGWHPIRASRIWQTGTTATNIVACY